MRSPRGEEELPTVAAAAPSGAVVESETRPAGGKALARLHQLELARGLPETDVAAPTVAPLEAALNGGAYIAAHEALTEMQKDAEPRSLAGPDPAGGAPTGVPVPSGWRPLGPFFIPHGQTYGSGPGSRPAVSGRVSAVAVHPTNANLVLAGAAGGGVWRTTDNGATWSPRTDNQPSLATGAIAFTPSDPNVVYAGTGEGNFFFRLGAGVLKSTDAGDTWSMVATAPFVGQGFFDLNVDPTNANRVLSASTAGIHESTNAGAAWTARRNAKTWDLSRNPASSSEVFAACSDGLFRSTDGGTTWVAVALPGGSAAYSRMAVAHAPSNGAVAWVFAADANGAHIWRRTSVGGAFTAVTPAGVTISTGQAWYDWFLGVAPNNPNVVYLGEIHVLKGTLSGATLNLVNISSKSPTGDSIHPDQHCIAFGPTSPDDVLVGCDGGLFRSPDGGTTWKSLNRGLCITEFEFLAQHSQTDAWLLGGTQDNGTERYEGEETWYHVQDGDGGDCGSDASNPYTCYQSFFGLGLRRSTTGGGWGSFSPLPLPASGQALFYPPMEVRGSIVVQAGSFVFISENTGTSWPGVVGLPSGQVASALAIPSSTRVYVGTVQGNVFRIDKSGGSWSAPVALTQPRAGFVSDLLVDPTNPNVIWATYSTAGAGGHVFRSVNAGSTWTNVSGGLPAIPVNAIEIDPANTNRAWIAADVGVYQTTNAGASWGAFSNLLPNALAKDLVFHAGRRLLRCGTQSRGVWEIAVDAAAMPATEVYVRDSLSDTARAFPSPSGVSDPFTFGASTFWWECTDIKVDTPPFQTGPAIDFGVFNDDHGLNPAGLQHENAQRGKTVRVFVQVHNRGPNPATNVDVKVFFADASAGLPNLPANFWSVYPNGTLNTATWKEIAPKQQVTGLTTGAPRIVRFDWPVPATAATHTCLLAVVTAANDPIPTGNLNVATLVPYERRCGLKNLHVVDAPGAVKLNLWGSEKEAIYHLAIDQGGGRRLSGLVFSKPLAELARKLKAPTVPLDDSRRAQLDRAVADDPKLKEQLDLTAVFGADVNGVVLKGMPLYEERPEVVVALVDAKAGPGSTAILQLDAKGAIAGGFTIRVPSPPEPVQ